MKGKKIIQRACSMPELDKDALICQMYGYFEVLDWKKESANAEDLFNVFEEVVEDLEKEKLARAATQTSNGKNY